MPDISIILPTYNEKENIKAIIEEISKNVKKIKHEIIVVDDNSPDKTYEAARKIALKNKNVKVIRRVHDKGLSSAVVDGFTAAQGKYLMVMDADLQHDASALPKFLEAFKKNKKLVIGTRKSKGGSIENWSAIRKFISWCSSLLAKIVLPYSVSDPMSGYFGVEKSFFEQNVDSINPRGFKILLEFIIKCKKKDIEEIGFTFRPRIYGQSKLSGKVMLDYLIGLYDLRFGKYISLQFIKYGLVGFSGVLVNELGLWTGKTLINWNNEKALLLGIELSILSNFFLNNYWTFNEYRLKGLSGFFRGLLSFHSICIAGAVINYAIALFLHEKANINIYAANLAGIVMATAWNYLINIQITWKTKR
ncbi:MAG: glycosyltransferase [Spirochaetia bacterium]|nr:glycosyltransferase [Spirochaetia bacterium]